MPHPFRIETSVEIEATPEEVWEALTIGEQLDGWWIGAPNEVEPRLGGAVRQIVRRPDLRVDHHRLGPAASLRRRGHARAGRRGACAGVHPRGPIGDDDRALRAQRIPRRRLGVRVRGARRGRPDVHPPAGASTSDSSAAGRWPIVEHFQPGHHRPGRRRWRSSAERMGLGDAAAVGDAVRLEPAGLGPSRARWTTCRRPSSACAPTTRSTGSRSSRWVAASTWATTSTATMSTSAAATSAWAAWLERAVAAGEAAPAG